MFPIHHGINIKEGLVHIGEQDLLPFFGLLSLQLQLVNK